MIQEQVYRVVFGPVQIRLAAPVEFGGQRFGGQHVDQGALLPPGVDPVQLQHLLKIGMVEPVQPTAVAEPAEAAATG